MAIRKMKSKKNMDDDRHVDTSMGKKYLEEGKVRILRNGKI